MNHVQRIGCAVLVIVCGLAVRSAAQDPELPNSAERDWTDLSDPATKLTFFDFWSAGGSGDGEIRRIEDSPEFMVFARQLAGLRRGEFEKQEEFIERQSSLGAEYERLKVTGIAIPSRTVPYIRGRLRYDPDAEEMIAVDINFPSTFTGYNEVDRGGAWLGVPYSYVALGVLKLDQPAGQRKISCRFPLAIAEAQARQPNLRVMYWVRYDHGKIVTNNLSLERMVGVIANSASDVDVWLLDVQKHQRVGSVSLRSCSIEP